jgi:hypothetical protein
MLLHGNLDEIFMLEDIFLILMMILLITAVIDVAYGSYLVSISIFSWYEDYFNLINLVFKLQDHLSKIYRMIELIQNVLENVS